MNLFNKILVNCYEYKSGKNISKVFKLNKYKSFDELITKLKSLFALYWNTCDIEVFGNFNGTDCFAIHSADKDLLQTSLQNYLTDNVIMKCSNWYTIIDNIENKIEKYLSKKIDYTYDWDFNTSIINLYTKDGNPVSRNILKSIKEEIKSLLDSYGCISYNIKALYEEDSYSSLNITVNPKCKKIKF